MISTEFLADTGDYYEFCCEVAYKRIAINGLTIMIIFQNTVICTTFLFADVYEIDSKNDLYN
jgi:hypothetical protein